MIYHCIVISGWFSVMKFGRFAFLQCRQFTTLLINRLMYSSVYQPPKENLMGII